MMLYICTKFHENILNGIRGLERTQKVNGRTDGQTDRRTDGGHDIIRPVFDGRIKKREMDWQLVACYFTVKSTDIFCSSSILHISTGRRFFLLYLFSFATELSLLMAVARSCKIVAGIES